MTLNHQMDGMDVLTPPGGGTCDIFSESLVITIWKELMKMEIQNSQNWLIM